MTDDIDWQLLHRYVAGEALPGETETVERWLAADPARQRLLDSLRDLTGRVAEGREPPVAWDAQAQWERTAARLRSARSSGRRAQITLRPSRAPARWPLQIAAAIALLVGGTLAWWAVQSGGNVPAPTATQMQAYTTPAGQRAEFRLADGTRVVLGVASTLRVPTGYNQTSRDVHLDGEAYFDVIHDEARPFAVHAHHAVARDLGTRFGVRAYAGDERVQVVVAEGEVGVRGTTAGADDEAILTPDQLARVDTSGAMTVQRDIDAEEYLAWTSGTLAFRDTPLQEALAQLGRWYDLDVQLVGAPPAVAARRVTGSYRGEPVEQVLEHIALAVNLRYERSGRTVTFGPK